MADEFDEFLAAGLAPEQGLPDRSFVLRVQAAIALEEQLAAQRRSLVGAFIKQLLALSSIAAAVWLLGHAPPVEGLFSAAPGVMLIVVLTSFVCAVGLIGSRPRGNWAML